MKKILLILAFFATIGSFALPTTVSAADACEMMAVKSGICDNKDANLQNNAKNIINTMLYIVGIGAVIMIIYGGIIYVISAGESGKINQAKTIIMYSVVGLVIAMSAFVIVNFVISRI